MDVCMSCNVCQQELVGARGVGLLLAQLRDKRSVSVIRWTTPLVRRESECERAVVRMHVVVCVDGGVGEIYYDRLKVYRVVGGIRVDGGGVYMGIDLNVCAWVFILLPCVPAGLLLIYR